MRDGERWYDVALRWSLPVIWLVGCGVIAWRNGA